MNRFFEKLGKFSVHYRWLIVAIWVLGSFATIKFLPSISSVVKTNNQAFLPANSPSIAASKLAQPLQNSNDSITLLVGARSQNKLTNQDLAAFSVMVSV